MKASPEDIRARNLRTVAILAGLFLIPLVLAFLVYYGTSWRPAGRTNHGELILPARALPRDSPILRADAFTQRWSLVYVGDGACDDDCKSALYVMRQTQLALNNDMQRVRRVFLASTNCCAKQMLERDYPGLIVIDASADRAAPLLRQFPRDERAHALFIVDPLGNLMMRFDTRANPKGLHEDLVALLKLSHIG
jgi:hypothetical protein